MCRPRHYATRRAERLIFAPYARYAPRAPPACHACAVSTLMSLDFAAAADVISCRAPLCAFRRTMPITPRHGRRAARDILSLLDATLRAAATQFFTAFCRCFTDAFLPAASAAAAADILFAADDALLSTPVTGDAALCATSHIAAMLAVAA